MRENSFDYYMIQYGLYLCKVSAVEKLKKDIGTAVPMTIKQAYNSIVKSDHMKAQDITERLKAIANENSIAHTEAMEILCKGKVPISYSTIKEILTKPKISTFKHYVATRTCKKLLCYISTLTTYFKSELVEVEGNNNVLTQEYKYNNEYGLDTVEELARLLMYLGYKIKIGCKLRHKSEMEVLSLKAKGYDIFYDGYTA